MDLDVLFSPLNLLRQGLGPILQSEFLQPEEAWWESEGKSISEAVDRGGTPWVRMFDRFGARTDEVLFPAEYWKMLRRGYRAGVVWRVFEEKSLLPACLLIYHASFYDPGVTCPYTVSLATAVSLFKYGSPELHARFLPPMLRKDDTVWQGATWMTEIKGGSDLGANVETVAHREGDCWFLTGDKYFCSNVGAELAVVAARPEGAPPNIRGLELFLLPRTSGSGRLNYFLRRLKNKIATRSVPTGEVELRGSEAHLLGETGSGIYRILEVLNLSRVANSLVSVALAQRAAAEALAFARRHSAFGRPIVEHPLLRRQFEERLASLQSAFALAWEAARLLEEVWQERPAYSERYQLFRLMAHLAKYWTAEFAVQTAKWAMEVHGGLGVLHEFHAERWLREAMILSIWEGTSHRHMLDALEVMERKAAHQMLFAHLAPSADAAGLREMESLVARHLALPREEKEASAGPLFERLAVFTAGALSRRSGW